MTVIAVKANGNGRPKPVNRLNDLSAKEWIPETVSVWIQRGLGQGHAHAQIERQHPAPFSFQDVARLVRFFTKSGELVLDPFVGVGSTLKAAAVEGRKGIGVELNKKYVQLARQRLKVELNGEPSTCHDQKVIQGDARRVIPTLPAGSVKLVVTSPPYWNILHKRDHKAKQERVAHGLDTQYSDDPKDLGNIETYPEFLKAMADTLALTRPALADGGHLCVIVGDFRHGSKYFMLHADLAREMESRGFTLKGIKVLYQRHKRVFPYGFPYSYVPNLHHQYIVILRKMIQTDSIYAGDALEFIGGLPDASADLIIADPPYSLEKDKEFGEGAFFNSREEWLVWCKRWLTEANRILKPTGNLFVYCIHHNACFLQCYMYELGLEYRRQIIWHYENGFSKHSNAPACHYEPILWFAKQQDFDVSRHSGALQKSGAFAARYHQERQGVETASGRKASG